MDDMSGIRGISGTVTSPTGKALQGFACQREAPESNRYVGRVNIPKDAEEGMWHINFLNVSDQASNSVTLAFAQSPVLQAAQLQVTSSRSDKTPPTVKAAWIDHRSMRAGEKNTLFVQAQDDKSGVNLVSAVFISPKRLARIGVACQGGDSDLWTCGSTSEQVLLWPDTFNNYFHSETAIAAVEVLEAAGYQVRLPRGQVCCGRPLYDFGMLGRAKQLLVKTLAVLDREITSGTPIVVLEPSCASVFQDELLNLLPDDDRSRKLSSQVFLLSEFLEKKAPNLSMPKLHLSALLHGHCHQKSIMKMTAEEALLRRMGVEHQSPAPGCCGMAGAFGFEKDKYDVSLAIAELELLPAIRKAPLDSLLISDGFSCREQIKQCTGRRALHLAEVIQMALRH